MTITNKPVPQTPAGERADQPTDKDREKERKNQVKNQNPAGPSDVAQSGDREAELEDGSSEAGAAEVPSVKDRGDGEPVNAAR